MPSCGTTIGRRHPDYDCHGVNGVEKQLGKVTHMTSCRHQILTVLALIIEMSIYVSLIAQEQPQRRPVDINESLLLANPIIYCPHSCEDFIRALKSRLSESKISYSSENVLAQNAVSNNNIIAIGPYSDSLISECLASTPLRLNGDSLGVDSYSYLGDDIRMIFHIPNPYNSNKNILIYTAQDEKNIADFFGYAESIKNWDFVAYRKKEGDRQEGNMILAGTFKEKNGKITVDSLRVWRKESVNFHITIKEHITYLFPQNSYAFSHRDSLVDQCERAIKKNLAIIGEEKYSDKMQIQFVGSRDEMKSFIGFPASGQADPFQKVVYLKCDKDDQGPIVHELMHMVVCNAWGFPGNSSTWLNEGFAIYADNSNCQYKVDQLYAYFLEKRLLIPIDSLTSNFYKQPEMIAYYQSGYVVQYLIERYGLRKIKELWQLGFQDFEKIYGAPFQKVEMDLRQELKQKIPVAPKINWKF